MPSQLHDSTPLRCAVIGAGLAGLGAAISLRRAGHSVDIYERSSFKHEHGAAIVVQPNGGRIFEHWGFSVQDGAGIAGRGYQQFDWQTAERAEYIDFTDNEQRFGYPAVFFHRVDLHAGLRRLAEEKGARVHLGTGVKGLDCEKGVVQFEDGAVEEWDLIVVANGVHCPWVDEIAGASSASRPAGANFRVLVPMEKVLAHPRLGPKIKASPASFYATRQGPRGIWSYPCRNGELLSMAVAVDSTRGPRDPDAIATTDEIVANLEGCHEDFHDIARMASPMHAPYPMVIRQPVQRMNRGKVVMIGDAAHSMLPTHGQGANMAFEDAALLEILFDPSRWDSTQDSVESMLDLFNQIRLPRNAVVQLLSNAMMTRSLTDEDIEDVRKYYQGAMFTKEDGHFNRKVISFFSRFNLYEEADKALAQRKANGSLPDGVVQFFGEPTAV